MSRHHLVKGFNKAKKYICNVYNTSKNVLSNIDNGVKLFKHVYGVVHPLIDKYAGNNVNKGIMNAINSYDTIKSHAMNTHTEVEQNINNLQNSLVKKKHNFNFV